MTTYKELLDVMLRRYSCREYAPIPVNREHILEVLEAARIAPSACNRQPWKFIVADTPELCKKIALCYDREWARTVPAFIIAAGCHNEAWHRAEDGKDHTDVDLSIAVEHICLAATALGLGTCWICNFNPTKLNETLSLDNNTEPVAIIAIGYPARPDAPDKKRKPIEEIVIWGD